MLSSKHMFIVVAGFDNGDSRNPLNQCDYNSKDRAEFSSRFMT